MPEVDAFDVTPEYRDLADTLGLTEWNPVVWIGRLFALDNDFGEHWFDNWNEREKRRLLAEQHGLDSDRLLCVDAERFQDGQDGPCNEPEFRARFWHEVLKCLELSPELLFEKARQLNDNIKDSLNINPDDKELQEEYIEDLEDRIEKWKRAHEAM
jgi:hypothetical protein